METQMYFGAMDRIRARQLARMRVNPAIVRIFKVVVLVLVAIWVATLVLNQMADYKIKSNQYYNLAVYHNIGGFQPVK